MSRYSRLALVAMLVPALSGCAVLQSGGFAGGLLGAGAGALIGAGDGHTGRGAAIGAVTGAVAGVIVDRSLSRRAAELQERMDSLAEATEARSDARLADAIRTVRVSVDSLRSDSSRLVVSLPNGILFDFDEDRLSSDAIPVIRSIVRSFEPNEFSVQAVGHTDSVGSATYNLDLSMRRARNVADALRLAGWEGDVPTSGVGFTQPVADNGSEDGRARNRRVEILLTPAQER